MLARSRADAFVPRWPAGCAGAVVCADDEECADRAAREARAASPANFIWTQVPPLCFLTGLPWPIFSAGNCSAMGCSYMHVLLRSRIF